MPSFLRQEWTAKDAEAAKEMLQRIEMVAEEAGHHPEVKIGDDNSVTADLCSKDLGASRQPGPHAHLCGGDDQ